jgi:hypothetical protein
VGEECSEALAGVAEEVDVDGVRWEAVFSVELGNLIH